MRSVFQFLEYSLTGGYSFSVKLLVWIGALLVAALLAIVRIATEAELSIMSAVILPVIAVAWMERWTTGYSVCGCSNGNVGDVRLCRRTELRRDLDAGIERGHPVCSLFGGRGAGRPVARCTSPGARVGASRYSDRIDESPSLFQVGQDETERARRYGHPIAVAFLDLDNFKQLNDRLGHDVGDAALKLVAQIMEQATRTTDRTARLGR